MNFPQLLALDRALGGRRPQESIARLGGRLRRDDQAGRDDSPLRATRHQLRVGVDPGQERVRDDEAQDEGRHRHQGRDLRGGRESPVEPVRGQRQRPGHLQQGEFVRPSPDASERRQVRLRVSSTIKRGTANISDGDSLIYSRSHI